MKFGLMQSNIYDAELKQMLMAPQIALKTKVVTNRTHRRMIVKIDKQIEKNSKRNK